MKYEFSLHARPSEIESIKDKHAKLIQGLVKLRGSWGLPAGDYPAPDPGRELSAIFKLTRLLGKGIKGFVCYRYRGGLRDEGGHDDYIKLEFNPEKIDYRSLLKEAFPAYIRSFASYFGYVGDDEFGYIDFDKSRYFNNRMNVLRIHLANYFDETLCLRAFGIDATEVLRRIAGAVEHAEIINNGVYLVGSWTPLPITDADNFSKKIFSLLK
jgi:hypothetical protein